MLNAEINIALTGAIEILDAQIPVSVADMKQGLDNSFSKLIQSNENLAKSQDKHSRAMFWLTIALVGVGILQVASQLLAAYFSKSIQ